jgi:hypothetical protein
MDVELTATERAIAEAAARRRVGAPVYLRYAIDVGAGGDLLRAAAASLAFATRVLGPARDVYAAGTPDGDRPHLALTVRHREGSVALLGIGACPTGSPPVPATTLLIGDRGVVEGCPPPALAGAPASTPEAGTEAAGDAGDAGDTALVPLVAVIRRALQSGRPEGISSDE